MAAAKIITYADKSTGSEVIPGDFNQVKEAANDHASKLDALEQAVADLPDAPDLSNLVSTDDPRLSDDRPPLAHTHTASQVTDFNTAAGAIAAGLDATLLANLKDGVPLAGDSLQKLYNLILGAASQVNVANLAARNSYVVPKLPFNIFVTDDGDGRWALYGATTTGAGASFVKLSDPDLLNTVMSAAQIKAAYESNADTNAFTNAQLAKLNAITGTNTGDETGASIKSKLGISTLSGPNTGDQDISGIAANAAAIAAEVTARDLAISATSPQIRLLGNNPVMASPYTLTVQAGSGAPDGVSTVTGTVYTPSWKASTSYAADVCLLHPTDTKQVIKRTVSGTSRASYDATEQALWTNQPAGTQVNYPARWNCGFLYRKVLNGFDVYGPRGPKRSGDAQETNSPNGVQWSIDFDWYTVAGALEVPMYSTGQVRFIVDGLYVSATPSYQSGADDYNYHNVKLSGVSAGVHRVRIEVGGFWCWIGGIRLATADVLLPPSTPTTKSLCVVGDSYVEGATGVASSGVAVQDLRAYPYHLAKLLGITNYVGLGISSTGFTLPTGSTYMDRLSDIVALQPDYLFIQASGNDNPNKATTLPAAALAFYQAVKAGCPNTKIIAGGVFGWTASQANNDLMTATLKTQAATAGVPFLDTTGWAPATPAFIADNNHPSYAGSEFEARRYAVELARMWRLPI